MAPMQTLAVIIFIVVVVWCDSDTCKAIVDICHTSDNELVSWLKGYNMYQMDIIQSLQSYGIETVEQIESLPKNKLNEIWQTASLNMYQRFVSATEKTQSIKPKGMKREDLNQEESDAMSQYHEGIRVLNEEKELLKVLKEHHLDIWSNTTHIAQLLFDNNQNNSSVTDFLRIKSYVLKLKNRANLIFTSNKHLSLKLSQTNLFNEESSILDQIMSEQLKMQDFIDVILSILDQSDSVYNEQKINIRKYDQLITNRIQTRKQQLSTSLDRWKHDKTQQLSQAIQDIEIYITSLQKTLNQSYKYIEDKNLVSRERKQLVTQQAVTLLRMYPKYQNLSQFSEHVNDVASSVIFDASDADLLTDLIDTFGTIMTDEVSMIPPAIKLDRIVSHASKTSIVWSYTNFNIDPFGKANNRSHTICNDINLYVQNTPVVDGWSASVFSDQDSVTSCVINLDNEVLLRVQDPFDASDTFRIEYEMLSPIKLIVSDEMTKQRNKFMRFLMHHHLEKYAHVFEENRVHLRDILAFNGSINEILNIENWNSEKLLLVTSVAKWKSDENVKMTKRTLFDISTSSPLREEEQAVLNSFQKEQIKMNQFLQIILNTTTKIEELTEDVIDDAFNKLLVKKKNVISELNRIKRNKLNKLNSAVTAVEEYNSYLQNHLAILFEHIQDSYEYSEKRKQALMNYEDVKPFYSSSNYINDISTEISFDDKALRNFGEIKLQNVYTVPILTILNGETHIVMNGTHEMFMYNLRWEYKQDEDKANICGDINTYIDNVEQLSFTSQLVEHQRMDDVFKTICVTSIENIPFAMQNHTYTFKIEHDLQFPMKLSIYDTYVWCHHPDSTSSYFMIYILIAIAICFLTVMLIIYGPALRAKSKQ